MVAAAGFLTFMGWSLFPFGKKYVPDYYFNQLHEHHKNYFPEGKRLILFNGEPVDSIYEKLRVGVAHASRITEYSSVEALKRFGEAGRYGATEIVGEKARWIVSDALMYRRTYNPAMTFVHSGVPLPDLRNLGHYAVLVASDLADTLYLGVLGYRHVVDDTVNRVIVIDPSHVFFVNGHKRKRTSDRPLFIMRNGRREATLLGVEVEGKGGTPSFYDERVVDFGRWVDNTVCAVMQRNRRSGKVADNRLLVVNGEVYEGVRPASRVQATQGTVVYRCGTEALRKYGWKGRTGAVEVVGNRLKYFALSD